MTIFRVRNTLTASLKYLLNHVKTTDQSFLSGHPAETVYCGLPTVSYLCKYCHNAYNAPLSYWNSPLEIFHRFYCGSNVNPVSTIAIKQSLNFLRKSCFTPNNSARTIAKKLAVVALSKIGCTEIKKTWITILFLLFLMLE